ncbi:MAG: M13-type metalloendopeptidase [Lactovum sp.]
MIRVQDDLFLSVNEEWLKMSEIPADKPRISAFDELVLDNEAKLAEDLKKFIENMPEDKLLKEAVKFYIKAGDWESRNLEDFSAVKLELEKVKGLSSFSDFSHQIKDLLLKSQASLPFSLSVGVDMKDALHYTLEFTGPGLILPDTTYYAEDHPRKKELLDFWQKNSAEILEKFSIENAEEIAREAVEFDCLLALYSNTSEEWARYAELYHPVKTSDFIENLESLDFKSLIIDLVGELPEKVLVFEDRFYENFSSIISLDNWSLIKSWMLVKMARKATSYLTEDLRILGSAFQRFLTNVSEARSQEKHQLDITENYFSQVIGLFYGKKYFGEEAKKDVERMVESMIAVYQERLKANDWLSKETANKAIEKLDSIRPMIGYPDKLAEIYKKLIVSDKSLYQDVIYFDQLLTARHYEKFSEPVDKTEWHMPAHMVNAYYSSDSNTIVFPAAILQAPFYSLEQSSSANYGGIGAVIAHEISHAFDNNGAQFDKDGNLNKWWKDEDYSAFEKKQEEMITQFDGLKTEAGVANGKLIVSENIADNGGMAAALTAAKKEADYDNRAFFEQWATVWRMKASLEFQEMLLSMDVHAPAKLRTNVTVTNFDEFYKTFGVKEGDGMYRHPKDRLLIW